MDIDFDHQTVLMVSDTESANYDKLKSNSPPPPLEGKSKSLHEGDSVMNNLATISPTVSKQHSISSLPLDKFQTRSGKSFGLMNMEDLLTSILSSDELGVQSIPPPPPQSNTHCHYQGDNDGVNSDTLGNYYSIPFPICKKTVDEVWFEIQRDQPPVQQQLQQNFQINNIGIHESNLQRQQSLAEMTLEEFLINAGEVQPSVHSNQNQMANYPKNNNNIIICSNNMNNFCLEANVGMGRTPSLEYPDSQTFVNNLSNNIFVTPSPYQMLTQVSNNIVIPIGEQQPSNKTDAGNESGRGEASKGKKSSNKKRRRTFVSVTEEVDVKRQHRMMKNRESAARSRARKQAYTVEMEWELTELREEHEKLKQTVASIEKKWKNEVLLMKSFYETKKQKRTEKKETMRKRGA